MKVTQINSKLVLSFNYDRKIIDTIKMIEGRKYNPNNKTWEVDLSKLEEVKSKFPDATIILDGDYKFEKYMFKEEINNISDEKVKEFCKWALSILPDYFYTIPAASTGKYHPKYALGEGGLVRHTRAAIKIAIDLFRIYDFTNIEKDIAIASLLLHDGCKGYPYSNATHPLDVTKHIEGHMKEKIIEDEIWNTIKGCIESHMGKWNKDYKTEEVVTPVPITELQKFVHLCDYIASRRYLECDL